MRQGDSVPATVSAGILTQGEFDSVTRDVQRRIDEGTERMLANHGPEWLRRERDHLRGQLEFLYGVESPELKGEERGPQRGRPFR